MTGAHCEQVLLVGVAREARDRDSMEAHLEELAGLTTTAGGEVVEKLRFVRRKRDPATLIGRGQAEEVETWVKTRSIDLVIFDDDLSPAQVRNLERLIQTRILDRSGLILDIFSRRARTHEARTQVALASLAYQLPRLTGRWRHLERQEGGIGTRGVGEKQIELDRRLITKRMAKLRRDLATIEKQRREHRRTRKGEFRAALVGYTNAGKSTLMNQLTGADGLVEDKLFATLDPTIRQVRYEGLQDPPILLIDTVGFIRKLPHHLVASFRSTLAETKEADLLLHVIDGSAPDSSERFQATRKVLDELGAAKTPYLVVLTKMDRVRDTPTRNELGRLYPDAIRVSGTTGAGLSDLLLAIKAEQARSFRQITLRVPQDQGKILAAIRRRCHILSEHYDDGYVAIEARGRPKDLGRIEALLKASDFQSQDSRRSQTTAAIERTKLSAAKGRRREAQILERDARV